MERFVLLEGGAKPRPEEEQNAVGGSEGVDTVKLRLEQLVRRAVSQNLSGQCVGPMPADIKDFLAPAWKNGISAPKMGGEV